MIYRAKITKTKRLSNNYKEKISYWGIEERQVRVR